MSVLCESGTNKRVEGSSKRVKQANSQKMITV